jgi:hypothetical protein
MASSTNSANWANILVRSFEQGTLPSLPSSQEETIKTSDDLFFQSLSDSFQPTPPTYSTSQKRAICKIFYGSGRCKNGEKCKYLHILPTTIPTPKPSEPASLEKSREICWYNRRGLCKYGNSCRFMHILKRPS